MKKKLLFLMPSLVGGGAERTLINLLHKIDYNIYEVDLVSVLNAGVYLNQVPDSVRVITLFNSDFLVRTLAWLQKKYGFVYFFKKRMTRKVKGRYQVGISFLDGNFTDLLFLTDTLERRITWVHGSYKSNLNFARFYEDEKYKAKLKKYRYGKLDGIYFVSDDSMGEFIEVFGNYPEMKVVYNLIDSNEVIKKAKEPYDIVNDAFQFVALGSLLPVKGFDRLVRAAKIVKDAGLDFNIKIAGVGPEEQKLKKMVSQYDLTSTVVFAGFLKNPYPLLKSADVFVMSSVSEALPTVLCEALILGKPTLVTNCSGCREIINSGEYGLMAEQSDADLAAKMIRYLEEPLLLKTFEKKSLERAEIFDDQRMLTEYYSIFDKHN